MKFYYLKSQNIFLFVLFTLVCTIAIAPRSISTQLSALSAKVTKSPLMIAASPYPRRSFTLRDQVAPGSSFDRFRQRLKQAIQQRDAKFIRAIADPQIKITFGPPIKFSTLGFDNPNSLVWKRLERILSTGCTPYEAPAGVEIDAYQCPHVSQAAMGDPFSDIYIIGEAVNVRSQPQSNSRAIGVLNNEILKFDSAGFERFTKQQRDLAQTLDGWMPVIIPTGERGYVSSRYAFFAAGYRARFENKKGQWKMTVFITGD
ncbi:SH3 domain-containing protein [Floridanema aerugineum]|uniref:SH3 domain-containing protein n=1 Tax=Floridaenema aerugineum BLCC-F46 TaxID=3153654 RepID=A0ABV4XB12_9CYAN